jgi:hypothetical protein
LSAIVKTTQAHRNFVSLKTIDERNRRKPKNAAARVRFVNLEADSINLM